MTLNWPELRKMDYWDRLAAIHKEARRWCMKNLVDQERVTAYDLAGTLWCCGIGMDREAYHVIAQTLIDIYINIQAGPPIPGSRWEQIVNDK